MTELRICFSLKRFIYLLLFALHFFAHTTFAQNEPKFFPALVSSNLRGLSVVDDTTCWVSGSQGWVGVSIRAGSMISWEQIPGYERFDFRSIHAIDADQVLIANAGSPAVILRTANGGKTWNPVYMNADSSAFIDGLAFWDTQHGIMVEDPIQGHFLIFITGDGGQSWQALNHLPAAFAGEACFAASGTCIQTGAGGNVWIGTGGTHARLLHSSDFGNTWEVFEVPIIQGKASQGIFSVCFSDSKNGMISGGDYAVDSIRTRVFFITRNGGKTWQQPRIGPNGFRSCISQAGPQTFICTGTCGTDISSDKGKNWITLDDSRLNTVAKARKGKWVYLAGENGRVAVWKK
jgi:photosystem II stability/assembly factor-like uncharacterized protein